MHPSFADCDYGLGWLIQKIHGHNVVWHNGGFVDCSTVISRFIDDDICIIILGNISCHTFGGMTTYEMANGISAILFGKPYDMPKAPKKHVEISINPEIYDRYVGVYKAKVENTTLTFVVTKEQNKLFVKLEGQDKYEVYPESETEFFYKIVDAQITFVNRTYAIMQNS
jgi:hypothetical protein